MNLAEYESEVRVVAQTMWNHINYRRRLLPEDLDFHQPLYPGYIESWDFGGNRYCLDIDTESRRVWIKNIATNQRMLDWDISSALAIKQSLVAAADYGIIAEDACLILERGWKEEMCAFKISVAPTTGIRNILSVGPVEEMFGRGWKLQNPTLLRSMCHDVLEGECPFGVFADYLRDYDILDENNKLKVWNMYS